MSAINNSGIDVCLFKTKSKRCDNTLTSKRNVSSKTLHDFLQGHHAAAKVLRLRRNRLFRKEIVVVLVLVLLLPASCRISMRNRFVYSMRNRLAGQDFSSIILTFLSFGATVDDKWVHRLA